MKPCPFCGSNEINHHYPDEHGHYVCWCGNCGAFGPNDISEAKAREMWNLRRPMDGGNPFVLEPEMIRIPDGEFLMGCDPKKDKDAQKDEQPQHTLHLPEYYIAKTPVTNVQYLAFVEAAGREPPRHWKGGKPPGGKEDHPVVWVSWHDAIAYCQWLAEATGNAYRLPSEAEWEKAARGTDGLIWPWGKEWEKKLCNSSEGGPGDTTPVGQYSPGGDSPYGCVDMVGNVWEWTWSLFKDYPYDLKNGREDTKAEGDRVLRGGAFSNNQGYARCAYRSLYDPSYGLWYDGFRVVVAPGL